MTEDTPNVKERIDDICKGVMAGLTPFQRATVNHVIALYKGQKTRVLVADEVGLGKTLVAKGVAAQVACMRRDDGDDLVKIAYICSNAAIASQNISRLRFDSEIHLSESSKSRLSMQHLVLAEEKTDDDLRDRFVQLIPLTPQTSFELSGSTGTMRERALMLAVLLYDPAFSTAKNKRRLKKMLWQRRANSSEGNWNYLCSEYAKQVKTLADKRVQLAQNGMGKVYPQDILESIKLEMNEDAASDASAFRHEPVGFNELIEHIELNDVSDGFDRNAIVSLRRAFSKVSIDLMEPDFVIMDEFQRFRDLIANNGSEASLLADKFLSGEVRVLLLSATPFRLYSTSNELIDGSFGNSYEEFLEVVRFLSAGDDTRYDLFEEVWSNYSNELSSIMTSSDSALVVCQKKDAAQAKAREFIARTERISTNELGPITDGKEHTRAITIDTGDIKSFHAARNLVEEAGVRNGSMTSDYIKSCPYPLSFMREYVVKKALDRSARNNWERIERTAKRASKLLWVNRSDIRSYKRLMIENARYKQLENDVLGNDNVCRLLWVPPSLPYYRPPANSAFANVEHFSKTLVFSSWAMVPPALSTLLSYEAERRNINRLSSDYLYFNDNEDKDEENDSTVLPHRRLLFGADRQNSFSLVYPSPYLESLLSAEVVQDSLSLAELRRTIKQKISNDLKQALGINALPQGGREIGAIGWYAMATFALDKLFLQERFDSYCDSLLGNVPDGAAWTEPITGAVKALRKLLAEFEEWNYAEHIQEMPRDLVDILTDAAIGSPAVCALRAYNLVAQIAMNNKQRDGDLLDDDLLPILPFEFGYAFMRKMNTIPSTVTVAAAMGEGRKSDRLGTHWKRMLAYCCEGNFQAMLDEYVHLESAGLAFNDYYDFVELHCRVTGGADNGKLPSVHNAESNHVIETFDTFKASANAQSKRRRENIRLRTNFANAFMETKDRESGNVSRDKKRAAFNSPFRPFVLISTSIGQEGLDFHQYCRKVVHWNLPSNPIDLEQREGRINRYKGLAIRQNIADRYGSCLQAGDDIWNQLFEIARNEEQQKSGADEPSGLLPYWGIADSPDMVKIERYVYPYPFSRDEIRYEYLLDAVRKYRAVLGQPEQEELLAKLDKRFGSKGLIADNYSELFMNLCPFVWEHKRGDYGDR